MDLSIILVNFNSLDYTLNCIQSIYDSNLSINFEIVLIDNASDNNPQGIVLEKFPAIRYYKNDENLGFSKANNQGINYAVGNVILLLNNDTIVNKDAIERSYFKVVKNNTVGALSCQLRYPNGEIQHNCQSFPSIYKKWIEKFRLHKLISKKYRSKLLQGFYWDYEHDGLPDWIWGTFFMFRKDITHKLPNNKLNDEYFMYMEDMHWCWDIRKAGYDVYYLSSSYIVHFGGGSGANKQILMRESMEIFEKRNL